MDLIRIVLYYLLMAFQLIMLARVLLTWFPNIDPRNPIVQFIYNVTEPVLRPIRQALPQTGMIDFSPLIVFIVIFILMQFVI